MKYFALLLLLLSYSLNAYTTTVKIRAVVPSSLEIEKKYFDYPRDTNSQSLKNESNKNMVVKKHDDGSCTVTVTTNQ